MALETENKEFVCCICGERSEHTVITKTDPPAGAPDLDLRPAEPHRGYMKYWAMECPNCGYCNVTLDAPADFSREYVESEEYRSCGGIDPGENDAASRLIRKALGCIKNHSYKEAVQSYLYAAWMFDDAESTEEAVSCRKAAVRIMDGHPAAFKGDNNFKVLKADLLRRSGEYTRVVREYEGRAYPSQLMTAIAFFEVQLASKGDSAAHRADEIPGVSAK